jgi:hypothetical protein
MLNFVVATLAHRRAIRFTVAALSIHLLAAANGLHYVKVLGLADDDIIATGVNGVARFDPHPAIAFVTNDL